MVSRFFWACRFTWSRARLMASCIDSLDSCSLFTSCSLPTMMISQMLRYFSTCSITRVSITSSKSLSMILASFVSMRSRISGVTSKLRPMMPLDIRTASLPCRSERSEESRAAKELLRFAQMAHTLENLLAVGRRGDVQLVAVFRDGAAGDVDPLVVEDLHDLGVRERFAGILTVNEALNLLLDGKAGDVLARVGVDSTVKEVLHEEETARRVHVLVRHDAGDGGLVHLDVVGHVAQNQGAEEIDSSLQELALVLHDRFGHLVDGALALVE